MVVPKIKEKVAVFGDIVSVAGIDSYTAAEIKDIIDVLIPTEVYDGYIVLNGEYIVFRKNRKIFVIVVIEEDRKVVSEQDEGDHRMTEVEFAYFDGRDIKGNSKVAIAYLSSKGSC